LLPLEKVEEGYREIVRFIHEKKIFADFTDFLAYFRATWFISYPKKDWNVSTVNRRTNNNVEGYNHKIKTVIKQRPNQWEFLDSLIDLVFDATIDFDSDKKSNAKPPVDRSRISKPLKKALTDLNAGTISVFGFLDEMSKDFTNEKITKQSIQTE
jgi:hypothetical protein